MSFKKGIIMATFETKCPFCGAGFEADEEWIGETADCPGCGKEIMIQAYKTSLEPEKKKLAIKVTASKHTTEASESPNKSSTDVKYVNQNNKDTEVRGERNIYQPTSHNNDVVVKSSAFAIKSLIFGILFLIFPASKTLLSPIILPPFIGFLFPIFGLFALVFGVLAIMRVIKGTGSGIVMAIVGIICFILQSGLLLPFFSQAPEKSRRISCASNLKQIGLAIRMYSQEYREHFPDKSGAEGLEMLRAGGYLENTKSQRVHVDPKKMYTCPSTKTIPARDEVKLTEDTVDYVYIGGYTEADSVDTIIAYDKPNNHVKYRNILYVDGHVEGYAGANWIINNKMPESKPSNVGTGIIEFGDAYGGTDTLKTRQSKQDDETMGIMDKNQTFLAASKTRSAKKGEKGPSLQKVMKDMIDIVATGKNVKISDKTYKTMDESAKLLQEGNEGKNMGQILGDKADGGYGLKSKRFGKTYEQLVNDTVRLQSSDSSTMSAVDKKSNALDIEDNMDDITDMVHRASNLKQLKGKGGMNPSGVKSVEATLAKASMESENVVPVKSRTAAVPVNRAAPTTAAAVDSTTSVPKE